MALKVLLPTALRHLAANQDEVQLSGGNVGEVMRGLVQKFPDLRKHLYNEDGRLRNFVNIYVNDEDIRFLGGETYAFQDGDEVMLIPSIAGGYC